MTAQDVLHAFENPLTAALTGVGVGAGLLLLSRLSIRFMTPTDPGLGLARVMTLAVARMALVLGALAAYRVWAPRGLLAFGISLVVAFLAVAGYEMFAITAIGSPSEGGTGTGG